jgi:hypothetical protein
VALAHVVNPFCFWNADHRCAKLVCKPIRLRPFLGWKRIAQEIGNFQARVLLTIFYAVLVLPFGIVVRLFFDPLRTKQRPTEWLDYPKEAQDLDWAKRQ